MYTKSLSISDYVRRFYRMEINASWITIVDSKTGIVLYQRAADNGPWYDATHVKIMDAIHNLETAVFNAVDFQDK